MAANQGKKIPTRAEIDELAPGKTQNVRETLDLDLAGTREEDCIRTPIHLPLNARFCFKADDRLMLGTAKKFLQPIAQDRDPTAIT